MGTLESRVLEFYCGGKPFRVGGLVSRKTLERYVKDLPKGYNKFRVIKNEDYGNMTHYKIRPKKPVVFGYYLRTRRFKKTLKLFIGISLLTSSIAYGSNLMATQNTSIWEWFLSRATGYKVEFQDSGPLLKLTRYYTRESTVEPQNKERGTIEIYIEPTITGPMPARYVVKRDTSYGKLVEKGHGTIHSKSEATVRMRDNVGNIKMENYSEGRIKWKNPQGTRKFNAQKIKKLDKDGKHILIQDVY